MSADGDSNTWDRVWKEAGGPPLSFSRSTPSDLRQFWQRCYFEDLRSLMQKRGIGNRCLELGSGRGTTSMYLSDQGCDVTLVDLSMTALEQAKENFARHSLSEPNCVCANANSTGLASDSFDCIYNIGVLEHFEAPETILSETLRLLRPGGLVFLVIVPSIPASRRKLIDLVFSPWRVLAPTFLRDWIKKNSTQSQVDENLAIRTTRGGAEYKDIMTSLGFHDVTNMPYNPYHPPYRGSAFERKIAIPLYRLHRFVSGRSSTEVSLRTNSNLALCDLVIASKVKK